MFIVRDLVRDIRNEWQRYREHPLFWKVVKAHVLAGAILFGGEYATSSYFPYYSVTAAAWALASCAYCRELSPVISLIARGEPLPWEEEFEPEAAPIEDDLEADPVEEEDEDPLEEHIPDPIFPILTATITV